MYRFTINQLLWFTGAIWSVFAAITYFWSPEFIFHLINPISIALGAVLILVYSSGLWQLIKDPEKRKQGISPAHLLTFGVTLNWIGMVTRMARWYFTGQHPAVMFNAEFWFYNFGLWVSIWGGLLLLGAASLAIKPFKGTTMIAVFLVVFAFLFWLGVHPIPDSAW